MAPDGGVAEQRGFEHHFNDTDIVRIRRAVAKRIERSDNFGRRVAIPARDAGQQFFEAIATELRAAGVAGLGHPVTGKNQSLPFCNEQPAASVCIGRIPIDAEGQATGFDPLPHPVRAAQQERRQSAIGERDTERLAEILLGLDRLDDARKLLPMLAPL